MTAPKVARFLAITTEMREWRERSSHVPYCPVCCVVHLFTPANANGQCAKDTCGQLRDWIRDLEVEPLDVAGLLGLRGEEKQRWSPLRLVLQSDWKRKTVHD